MCFKYVGLECLLFTPFFVDNDCLDNYFIPVNIFYLLYSVLHYVVKTIFVNKVVL